ncbi:MAG: flagellar basal body rod protein FlgB [Gammaproteobacteria bacterium]|nr:flagellar basal body rod protein FlgB [Gammaproteobacteria bacterium]
MDSIFGIHEAALKFRAARMDVLAANLANVDTPGYKARDVEFADALRTASRQQGLKRTDPRHIGGTRSADSAALKYRVPYQPSLDGNTVESDLELARFAENAIGYQASLMFVNGRISSLRAAISGGRR